MAYLVADSFEKRIIFKIGYENFRKLSLEYSNNPSFRFFLEQGITNLVLTFIPLAWHLPFLMQKEKTDTKTSLW